jgi:3-phosphoglycerate kinase
VPIKHGEVTSDVRIRASLSSVELALKQGASVILMSHLVRPVEGGTAQENAAYTMAPNTIAFDASAIYQESGATTIFVFDDLGCEGKP